MVVLKDTEEKYYTLDEYKTLIEGNQTDMGMLERRLRRSDNR